MTEAGDGTFDVDLGSCLAAIRAACPAVARTTPRPLDDGWDSFAIEMDGRLFKFPRHARAAAALLREVSLLAALRPHVALPVPDARLHAAPPLFSHYLLIPGEALTTGDYRRLTVAQRNALALVLAEFHRDLHGIPHDLMAGAGAQPVEAWLSPDETARRALPRLPEHLRGRAEGALHACLRLPADPLGDVFGMFDAHGWNMAFDHEAGRLNGIYDFGDAGFGPRHREFVYASFVSRDLTDRTVGHYERLTGLQLDRSRIGRLTEWHRLWELAVCDEGEIAAMQENVEVVFAR